MFDAHSLLAAVADVLRQDPELGRLAANWSAPDARGHVFLGAPPLGAANAGRAPFAVVELVAVRRGPHRGAVPATVTVAVHLTARQGADALAEAAAAALAAVPALGAEDQVLDFDLERGPVARAGRCETAELRLAVRLVDGPSA
ncbi:MAG: hypothetical protein ACLF0G_17745 [Candidatus Brocadiia bacterium]